MEDNVKTAIVVIGFLLVGMIAGYCIAELIDLNINTNTCNQQCQAYIDKNCYDIGIRQVDMFNYTG